MKRNTKTRFRRLCLLLPFLFPQINNSLGSLGRRIVSKRVGICVSTAGLDDNPVDAVRLFSRSVAPIKNTAGETDKHQIRDEDEFVHRVKDSWVRRDRGDESAGRPGGQRTGAQVAA